MLPTVQSEPFKSFNRVSRNPYFYQELNFLCQPARDYIVTDIINYASSVAVGFLKLGWIAFIQIYISKCINCSPDPCSSTQGVKLRLERRREYAFSKEINICLTYSYL